jgi:hypothetical protein
MQHNIPEAASNLMTMKHMTICCRNVEFWPTKLHDLGSPFGGCQPISISQKLANVSH